MKYLGFIALALVAAPVNAKLIEEMNGPEVTLYQVQTVASCWQFEEIREWWKLNKLAIGLGANGDKYLVSFKADLEDRIKPSDRAKMFNKIDCFEQLDKSTLRSNDIGWQAKRNK